MPVRARGMVWRSAAALLLLVAAMMVGGAFQAAHALQAIVIGPEQKKLDITLLGDLYQNRGDSLTIDTAPGPDGIAGPMSVPAVTRHTDPNWVVFALSNPSDKRIDRVLIARRYQFIGSQLIWPDLDAPRIAKITPSLGYQPQRIPSEAADLFRISLEPGATVTYVVELKSVGFARLMLWDGAALGKKTIDTTLLNGILLGIAGLLAIFLSGIFVANHRAIFPVTALVAWSVVAYLCVDFGFWHKLFQLSAEDNAIYRAAAEAAVAASLVIFLYVYLRVRVWHSWAVPIFAGWALFQLSLVGFSVIDAHLASGLARLTFLPIAGAGSLLILMLALRGDERALSLLPTWLLFLVWLFGAAMAVLGLLSGDIIVPALGSGLVLFIALLGFSVTQYAFHPGDGVEADRTGVLRRSAFALGASGASVWEWDVRRDEIKIGPEMELALGYPVGGLRGTSQDWLDFVHRADRERFRLMLWSVRERGGGDIAVDFRIRRKDGGHVWLELSGSSLPTKQSNNLFCAGLLRDVTEQKRGEERLLHNAILDSLTGLPNRELFLDRVGRALLRAAEDESKPTILAIDLDRLHAPTSATDAAMSDSILLTIARRLARHVRPLDSIARLGASEYAILLTSEAEPRYIAMVAERVRRSLRSPMKIGSQETVVLGSIGISVYDGHQSDARELLREAELAMYRAKRAGADRIELFRPEMRGDRDDRAAMEKALSQAVEKRQIKLLYQPIMRLADNRVVGFEALLRWDHPKLGRLSPPEFFPLANESGKIGELIAHAGERAIRQLGRWQRALPHSDEPVILIFDLATPALFKNDQLQEVRTVIGRGAAPEGALWLAISEGIITENPEPMAEALTALKSLGAQIVLTGFGGGYSSLAYLHRFPFDTIRVDRSIMQASRGGNANPAIMRAVLAMARELGHQVIASGVDRDQDAAYLRALGCDYGQGYYFGEPLSEKEVMGVLAKLAKLTPRRQTGSEGSSSSWRARAKALPGLARRASRGAEADGGPAKAESREPSLAARVSSTLGKRRRPRPEPGPANPVAAPAQSRQAQDIREAGYDPRPAGGRSEHLHQPPPPLDEGDWHRFQDGDGPPAPLKRRVK